MFSNSTSIKIPGFLVGKARTQWKGVMVRNTPEEQAGVTVITIDDVMGDIATSRNDLALAA